MDIIVINDTKLKVMLTKNDLSEFSLDTTTLDYTNSETKKMFWNILDQAKQTLGFSTDGYRILVQLYPSKAGGCEMFVTKLGLLQGGCFDSLCDNEKCVEGLDKRHVLHCKNSHYSTNTKGRLSVFGFDELSSLISVCRRLRNIGYEGNSSAYRCDDRKYHLFIDGIEELGFMPPDEFSFISEYGRSENSETMSYYISEHGEAICASDAVNILGVL